MIACTALDTVGGAWLKSSENNGLGFSYRQVSMANMKQQIIQKYLNLGRTSYNGDDDLEIGPQSHGLSTLERNLLW